MRADRVFYYFNWATIVLTFIVIVLGAYTRLSDAGLGCPDWPGCYGKLIVPDNESEIAMANEAYPDRPFEQGKAWKEMIHRYAAGTLGLLILGLTVIAWKRRNVPDQQVWLPTILLGLVIFQALLGMWTVTLLLKPIIVMGHLLGGMTILLLLVWMLLKQGIPLVNSAGTTNGRSLWIWSVVGLVVLACQISLGGWTSANYAALICPDFPVCRGQWWPPMNFTEGFTPWRGLGIDYEFGVLNAEARTAVHVSHRIGALITFFVLAAVAIRSIASTQIKIKITGVILLVLLVLQISLGIANVLLVLPITVAVAHNAVAAILLICMGALVFYTNSLTATAGRGLH